MVNINRALVLFHHLQQLFFGFCKTRDDISFSAFSIGHMQSTAHRHHRVKRCANRSCEGTAAFDDVGMVQTASTSKELHS